MSDVPNMFKLTGQAGGFVWQNIKEFRRHLLFVFPVFLSLALMLHLTQTDEQSTLNSLVGIVLTFVSSCFLLTWHRFCLRGGDSVSITPKAYFTDGGWKFHLQFMGFIFLLLIFITSANSVQLFLEASQNVALIFLGKVSTLIVLASAVYMGADILFSLPAQSGNVSLRFAELEKVSKGLKIKLIGSIILTTTTFILAMSIYLLIVSVILQAMGAGEEVNSFYTGLIAFFLSIPIYLAMFFYFAANVTVLSRLYQWGMQNNS